MSEGLRSIVVATRNTGKLHELAPIISAAGFIPLSLDEAGISYDLDEEIVEVHATFEENALAKARYYRGRAAMLGQDGAVLADDSGLEVEALGGQPGVRSRRWGGDATLTGGALDVHNNARLIAALDGVANRRARFVCVAALVWQGGECTGRGETAGTIIGSPRGGHGFGYDPLFLSDDLGLTLAEVPIQEKAHVSHRGQAMTRLLTALQAMR